MLIPAAPPRFHSIHVHSNFPGAEYLPAADHLGPNPIFTTYKGTKLLLTCVELDHTCTWGEIISSPVLLRKIIFRMSVYLLSIYPPSVGFLSDVQNSYEEQCERGEVSGKK